ncbi:MAG TPA: bifunctional DNA-formamidopyrimidine glycosylase/DNA-(apurinic or apyrimidinic site) lyase [Thiomicrorhabdus sp.]|nr:bifunctional DNA-formamidopyrimidine glycosylase/DNA-(apurinic or apyrimidinic site) lyase [Thiomicrorhabdus sp.]
MPELPEVETTCQGIQPYVENQTIIQFIIRNGRLRWPVEPHLTQTLQNTLIQSVTRRGKYILLTTKKGVLMLHLGMSGNLRILPCDTPPIKHDHIDITLSNHQVLRLNDPRRFGSVLWHDTKKGSVNTHKLLCNLAPEPLSKEFNADYLYQKIKRKNVAIKKLIMNNQIIVGAGNIYASEALFNTKIHPLTLGKELSKQDCQQLVAHIQNVLRESIKQGGTTLKDFLKPDGKPGYFVQKLNVYGRTGQSCTQCHTTIEKIIISQRASFFCPKCQPLKES